MANAKKKKLKAKARGSAKAKKGKARKPKKRITAKKQAKKPAANLAPMPVRNTGKKVRESFKKEIMKKLLLAKKELLAEVAEKIKNESNIHKFEIGDIYDIASTERERELTLMFGDRDREKLAEIEEAFQRLENGSYGLCDECGEPISEARLRAMPFTKVCIDCKSKDEREKGIRKRYEEEPGLAILEKTEVEEEEF